MTVAAPSSPVPSSAAGPAGPPRWLLLSTGAVAAACLVMAVAETNWWMHYLIDDGEYVSLVGLVFITAAGAWLYRAGRLLVSLPLAFPWLLFPVITQGDQLIDHLSINWMRLITHLILAALFATPVLVIVLATVLVLSRRDRPHAAWLARVPGLRPVMEGRVREGASVLAASLLVAEIWVAALALGTLMVVTLVALALGALCLGSAGSPPKGGWIVTRLRGRSERFALGMLLTGVAVSLLLFVGFKHRPGAYQGSPSHFMDPAGYDVGFRLDHAAVGDDDAPTLPVEADLVRTALVEHAQVLDRLVVGYHILDRNYTYDFHNHLFMRHTTVLPNYRSVGLAHIEQARTQHALGDAVGHRARLTLTADDPIGSLLDDVRGFVAYNVNRASLLERMSHEFERTRAGLQHAAHLYEGEGKFVTAGLEDILVKHNGVLSSPVVTPVTGEYLKISRGTAARYANRIVGF